MDDRNKANIDIMNPLFLLISTPEHPPFARTPICRGRAAAPRSNSMPAADGGLEQPPYYPLVTSAAPSKAATRWPREVNQARSGKGGWRSCIIIIVGGGAFLERFDIVVFVLGRKGGEAQMFMCICALLMASGWRSLCCDC